MRIPRPVDPPSLMFITIDVGEPSGRDRNGGRALCRQPLCSAKGEEENEVGAENNDDVRDDEMDVSKVIAIVSW